MWRGCNEGISINILSKTRKRGPTGKHFWVFYILLRKLTQRWTQSRPFFPKSGHFFRFSKRAEKASPSPLAEHLWVWLNMHWYPWICLNILENISVNCSDYARALNMHDHLTYSIGFWRCLLFLISQASKYGTNVYMQG